MNLYECLRKLALDTLDDCRVWEKARYYGEEREMTLLIPAGDGKYPSFWVRDTAMMAECGLIPDDELKTYVEIIALCGQNGAEIRELANGLSVPPYAVTDHINYNGRPVFFPGTYADGEDQGSGQWGFLPPLGDNYYFIAMAGQYVKQSGDRAFLDKVLNGLTVKERLERAFQGYNLSERGLCTSDWDHHTVNWGFVDSIVMGGELLFSSLLRFRAAGVLADLADTPAEAAAWTAKADALKAAILDAFTDPDSGWLFSSTGPHRQHDVWGTAFAVYLGITEAPATLDVLVKTLTDGTAEHGYVRHIPMGEDFSETTAWEKSGWEGKIYQNGPYWATPTGWLLYALQKVDRALADEVAEDFLAHMERYRSVGAPFEWMQKDLTEFPAEKNNVTFSGRLYGTSGCLPFAAAERYMK